MNLLYATTNPGKFAEAARHFEAHGYAIKSPEMMGLNRVVEETGSTLEENAKLKAEAYLPYVDKGVIVFGDDTGMYIDALGGEPGIKVRRWKGYKMTDEEIIKYTLERLAGVPDVKRGMTISIALSVATSTKPTRTFVGSYKTSILQKPKNLREKGFPFRPLITDEIPTHRSDAIKAALPYLSTLLSQNQ